MEEFNVAISDRLARRLRDRARETGVDTSELVAKWIEEHFDAARTEEETGDTKDNEKP